MTFQAVRSVTHTVASASVIRQGRVVVLDGNGNVIEAVNATAVPAGIALEASANGDTAAIPVALFDGSIVEVEAGGVVAVGASVMADGDGQGIVATGATAYAFGVAMDLGAAGVRIRVHTRSPSFAAQA